jgi:ABC-type multidrug transport system ATPase subunit
MKITLSDIGIRYHNSWIFKGLNFEFSSENKYAIVGRNGSGKSTLLQVISAFITPYKGIVEYQKNENPIPAGEIYSYLTISAPYVEVPEDFTLVEALDFHFKFRNPVNNLSTKEIISILGLESHSVKQLKFFSSGMKQRVGLVLAILSESDIILLDEPTSHLDTHGFKWYLQLIDEFVKDRLLIISSNNPAEYSFVNQNLCVEDYR